MVFDSPAKSIYTLLAKEKRRISLLQEAIRSARNETLRLRLRVTLKAAFLQSLPFEWEDGSL